MAITGDRRWRREQQLRKTLKNRPDLLEGAALSAEDMLTIEKITRGDSALGLPLRAAGSVECKNPSGAKAPHSFGARYGTTEVVPLQNWTCAIRHD